MAEPVTVDYVGAWRLSLATGTVLSDASNFVKELAMAFT